MLINEIKHLISEDIDNLHSKPTRYLNFTYEYHDEKNTLDKSDEYLISEIINFSQQLEYAIPYDYAINTIPEKKLIKLDIALDHFVNKSGSRGIISIYFPTKSIIHPSALIFVLWFIALGAILLIISLIFIRNQIRSILELSSAAENMVPEKILAILSHPEQKKFVKQA